MPGATLPSKVDLGQLFTFRKDDLYDGGGFACAW